MAGSTPSWCWRRAAASLGAHRYWARPSAGCSERCCRGGSSSLCKEKWSERKIVSDRVMLRRVGLPPRSLAAAATRLTLRGRLVELADGGRRRDGRSRIRLAVLRLRLRDRLAMELLAVVARLRSLLLVVRLRLRVVQREGALERAGAASSQDHADDEDDERDRHCDCTRGRTVQPMSRALDGHTSSEYLLPTPTPILTPYDVPLSL